jgi:hypothetical protein
MPTIHSSLSLCSRISTQYAGKVGKVVEICVYVTECARRRHCGPLFLSHIHTAMRARNILRESAAAVINGAMHHPRLPAPCVSVYVYKSYAIPRAITWPEIRSNSQKMYPERRREENFWVGACSTKAFAGAHNKNITLQKN